MKGARFRAIQGSHGGETGRQMRYTIVTTFTVLNRLSSSPSFKITFLLLHQKNP